MGTPREKRTDDYGRVLLRCSRCGWWKLEDDFYKNGGAKPGRKSECKPCHCRTTVETRNPDRARDYNRHWMRESGYAQRPEVLDRERSRARAKNQSLEARVRALVHRALALDLLKRPETCERCAESRKLHAHHRDYSKPLEVEWLCTECHGKEHRALTFKRVAP